MKGGANAAMADLARLRGNNADDSISKEQIAAANAALKAFDAAIVNLHSYPEGHPTLARGMEMAWMRLQEYWEPYKTFKFVLEAKSVYLEGTPVITTDKVEDNSWFPLFSAGCRSVSLLDEIKQEDFEKFLTIIGRFRGKGDELDPEDDPLIALWEEDIYGLEYFAKTNLGDMMPDGFMDNVDHMVDANMDPNLTKAEMYANGGGSHNPEASGGNACAEDFLTRADVFGQEYAEGDLVTRVTIHATAMDTQFLQRENLSALNEIPKRSEDTEKQFLEEDQEERDKLLAGWNPADFLPRYTTSIFVAIGGQFEDEKSLSLVALISEKLRAAILNGDFVSASDVVEKIVGEDGERRDLMAAAMSPDTVSAVTRAFLSSEGKDLEAVGRILQQLEDYVSYIVPELLKAEETVDLEPIFEVLEYFGQKTLTGLTGLISKFSETRILALTELIARIGGDNSKRLTEVTAHNFFRARELAYRHLLHDDETGARVSVALKALDDEHSLVRQVALEYFRDTKPQSASTLLQEQIEDKEFAYRDLAEKRRFYIAWAAVSGKQAIEHLEEIVSKKNWFRQKKLTEATICAVGALAHVRSVGSKDLLTSIASSAFTPKEVKDEIEHAMGLIDRPAAEQVRRRAPRATGHTASKGFSPSTPSKDHALPEGQQVGEGTEPAGAMVATPQRAPVQPQPKAQEVPVAVVRVKRPDRGILLNPGTSSQTSHQTVSKQSSRAPEEKPVAESAMQKAMRLSQKMKGLPPSTSTEKRNNKKSAAEKKAGEKTSTSAAIERAKKLRLKRKKDSGGEK